MERLKLAVAGKTAYMDRLTECIRKNAPEYLEISSCLNEEEIPEVLALIQPDILLYEQEMMLESKLLEHMVKIEITKREKVTVGEEVDRVYLIYRYQQGTEILRQVFQIYEQASKKNLVCWCKTMNLKMTAFYAPGGHELLLPFSMAYASLKKDIGKVLYMNLSEFSGMTSLFGNMDSGNLCDLIDLIYGIRQNKERFSLYLHSVLHHTEDFDYVLPPQNPQDLYQIEEEDVSCLMSLLREQTEYRMIVWNCGTLQQAVKVVMEYCSKVCCLVKENSFGKFRKAELEQFLEKETGKRIKEKVQYINPQAVNNGFVQGVDILTQLHSGEFVQQVERLTKDKDDIFEGRGQQ